MGDFPRYDRYKESGVEWLGEIPEHWEVKRVKYLCCVNPSGDRAKSDEIVTFLPMESVSTNGRYDISKVSARYTFPASLTEFKKHDIILAKITPCFENGKYAFLNLLPTYKGIGSSEFHVFRVFQKLVIENFFCYLLAEENFRRYATAFMEGSAGQKRVTTPFISNIAYPLPPIKEQKRIADFLDRKTLEIENAIAKKQRLIELLEEQKTILINQAVTKGLNPDVPMKDSGIDWIGKIPEHWEVKKLKHISIVQAGLTLGKKYVEKNLKCYQYLRVANVQYGYFKLDDIATVEIPEKEAKRCKVRKGDILVTEGGDIDKLGRGSVWNGEIEHCLHQNHIFAIRLNRDIANEYFISYIMSSNYGRGYFQKTATKTTNLASTNRTKLLDFPILLPSLSEQIKVIDRSQEIEKKHKKYINFILNELQKLKELKQILISQAVTGKIKI